MRCLRLLRAVHAKAEGFAWHGNASCGLDHAPLDMQVWEQIQEIRIFNDKGFVRWPPHINLLYPFYEDAGHSFEECADVLAAAVRSMSPFQVAVASVPVGSCCALSTADTSWCLDWEVPCAGAPEQSAMV